MSLLGHLRFRTAPAAALPPQVSVTAPCGGRVALASARTAAAGPTAGGLPALRYGDAGQRVVVSYLFQVLLPSGPCSDSVAEPGRPSSPLGSSSVLPAVPLSWLCAVTRRGTKWDGTRAPASPCKAGLFVQQSADPDGGSGSDKVLRPPAEHTDVTGVAPARPT